MSKSTESHAFFCFYPLSPGILESTIQIEKMKGIKWLGMILFATMASVWFTACSDDEEVKIPNEEPEVSQLEKVFPNGPIEEVDGMKFTYSDGKLTKATDDEGGVYVFTYAQKTKADVNAAPDVEVEYLNDGNDEYNFILKVWRNEQGFAEKVCQRFLKYEEEWTKTCQYDKDGHLTFMKDGRENREYVVTWADGDISHVQTKRFDDESGKLEWTKEGDFTYSGKENHLNVLYYYKVYDVDFDEVQILYWAGLLGMSPRHLAESGVETLTEEPYDEEDEPYTSVYKYEYEWDSLGIGVEQLEK